MAEELKGKLLLIENSASDFIKARLSYCKYLKAKGWDVHALVPSSSSLKFIDNSGINIIEYQYTRKGKDLFQILRLSFFFRKVIIENDIDVIHSFRFEPNLINIITNLFNRNKLVLHVTGLGIAFSKKSFKYKLLQFISQILLHFMIFRANVMILQNDDDLKSIWFARFFKKIKVIYGSGVDIKYFDNKLFDKNILREKYNISKKDIVFLIVTRLIWQKGITELIEAFLSKELQNRNLKLFLVGGTDKNNPQHIDDKYVNSFDNNDIISFLGKVEDVREFLAISDVFIYPSYYREGIPRGILEALSMSLPIITTNTPGCKLTVINGTNGFLIRPKSVKSIQESVLKLLDNKDFSSMGLVSRRIVEEKFSNEIIFAQFEETYNF